MMHGHGWRWARSSGIFAGPMTRPLPARQTLTGLFLILGAGFLVTVMDATAKHLAQTYPVVDIACGRYLFATLSLPLILHGFGGLPMHLSNALGLRLLRSV